MYPLKSRGRWLSRVPIFVDIEDLEVRGKDGGAKRGAKCIQMVYFGR